LKEWNPDIEFLDGIPAPKRNEVGQAVERTPFQGLTQPVAYLFQKELR
jgi:hypothetical protein